MRQALPERLRPKKSLGQNFLRDDDVARRIAAAVDPRPDDVLVEIGPGEGALTKHLLPSGCRLVLVELDQRVIPRLKEAFGGPRVEIVHGDFLATDLGAFAAARGTGTIRVAGNIPYYITSPILFHVLDQRHHVRDLTMMIQREVAQRLVAGPRTKDYGILSVTCQLFASVELLFDVAPGAFFPRPSVTSSVVRLTMREAPLHAVRDEELFRAMVRAVFGMRRKTLRNSLGYFLKAGDVTSPPHINLQRRPEELSVGELVELSNHVCEHYRAPRSI